MKEILIETGSCLVAAMLLMIWHEVIRLIVYACCQRSVHCFRTTPWKVWRYIDPIGLILSLTSCVPISKPYFYRVRDPITNRRLGVAGLVSLLMVFAGSILVLRFGYGGVKGLDHLIIGGRVLSQFSYSTLRCSALECLWQICFRCQRLTWDF